MTPSDIDILEADLIDAEGLRLTAYQDTQGVWTIGSGVNLQTLTITAAMAAELLTRALASAAVEAERFPWYLGLTSARQRAVVELIYNLGLTRYRGFTKHLAAMAAGDYARAADELLDSKWRVDVKERRAQRIAGQIRQG